MTNKIKIVSLIVITLVMVFSFLINNPMLFFGSFLLFPTVGIILYFKNNGFTSIKKLFKTKKKIVTVSVTSIKSTKGDMIDELLLSVSLFSKLNDFFKKGYLKDLELSGTQKSLSNASIKNLKMVLISSVFSIVITTILLLTTQNILSFGFLLFPVMVFLVNRYELKSIISQRKNGVEKELLFFSVFCDIMDNTQSQLYRVFEKLKDDKTLGFFPFMKKEAVLLDLFVKFGDSPFTALQTISSIHPSKIFTEFIHGYMTSESVGGKETGNYIEEKTREYQVILKQKTDSFISTSNYIAIFSAFLSMMYPLMAVFFGMFASSNDVLMMIITGLFFMPLITFILIKKIDVISPFDNDDIPLYKIPILIPIPIFILCIIINLSYWEIVLYPLMAWSIVNYLMIAKKLSINSNIDKAIPRFVRDMNQSMLGHYSFYQAFQRIRGKSTYTKDFDKILHNIGNEISSGKQLSDVMLEVKTNTSLSKLVLKIISFIAKSGEVTETIMEKLAVFSSHYLEKKQNMLVKTNESIFIAYAGIIILLFVLLVIPEMNISGISNIMNNMYVDDEIQLDESLESLNMVLVIVMSFLSMMLVSKIRYNTIKHSLHCGIILLIITGVLSYQKYIGFDIL